MRKEVAVRCPYACNAPAPGVDAAATSGAAPLSSTSPHTLAALAPPAEAGADQDYDCAHNSNPECSYVFYGSLCFPRHEALGVDIYTASGYGAIDLSWKPTGC